MTNYESTQLSRPKPLDEPARELLFDEHRALLRSAQLARVVNRCLLVLLILLQILYPSFSIRLNLSFIAAGVVAATFWYLQEYLLRRNISRLEELIIETYTERLDNGEADKEQKVFLKPVDTTTPAHSVSKPSQKEIWVKAYINWRQEHWRYARYEAAQNLEPIAWSTLLLILGIIRMLVL